MSDRRCRPFFDQNATIANYSARNRRAVPVARRFVSAARDEFRRISARCSARKHSISQELARGTAHRMAGANINSHDFNIISSAKDLASETRWPSLKRDCATKLNECPSTSLRE
jgi:hypothetical protein